jgi:hypothetical protein
MVIPSGQPSGDLGSWGHIGATAGSPKQPDDLFPAGR